MKGNNEKPEKLVKKKKKPEIIKTNLDILPVRHYDDTLDCFILSDNSCLDIFTVIPRDVGNMDDDELRKEMYGLIRGYKTIGSDIKFISLNFPLNTGKQREVLQRHREKASDEVRRKWLDRQIEELETVDMNIHTSNFYLLYFGKDKEEFIRNRENIVKYVCTGLDRLCDAVPKLQKIQIMVKICNMNNTYDVHYFDESEGESI